LLEGLEPAAGYERAGELGSEQPAEVRSADATVCAREGEHPAAGRGR